MFELQHRQNRSRIQIFSDILETAKSGAKKTHILYKCNLNNKKVNCCLRFLSETGLIDEFIDENGRKFYWTTDKGKDILSSYEKISILLPKKLLVAYSKN